MRTIAAGDVVFRLAPQQDKCLQIGGGLEGIVPPAHRREFLADDGKRLCELSRRGTGRPQDDPKTPQESETWSQVGMKVQLRPILLLTISKI